MHIAQIDYLSSSGESFFHRALPVTKMVFCFSGLFFVILSSGPMKLAVLFAFLLVLLAVARIPLKLVFHLLLYPFLFALFFALMASNWPLAARYAILLKAISSASLMLLLITTTSHVDVFGIFSRFMPRLLVDIMFFTYRTLFILLEQFRNYFVNVKLRGGYRPAAFLTNIRNTSRVMGVLIMHSYDMSQRMYQIYSLRGYEGGIPIKMKMTPLRANDILIFAFSIILLTGAFIPWNL
ncbi:MAG: energy-coupling factor transporter transmembrane component T [Clostridia bacterium]